MMKALFIFLIFLITLKGAHAAPTECPKSQVNNTVKTEVLGYRSCIQRTKLTSISIVGDEHYSLYGLDIFFARSYVSDEARSLYDNSRFWSYPANISLGVGATALLANVFLATNGTRDSLPSLWVLGAISVSLGIVFWYFEAANLTAAVNRYNLDLFKVIGQQDNSYPKSEISTPGHYVLTYELRF